VVNHERIRRAPVESPAQLDGAANLPNDVAVPEALDLRRGMWFMATTMNNARIEALLAEFSVKLATIVREEARAEVRAALDLALGGSPTAAGSQKSAPAKATAPKSASSKAAPSGAAPKAKGAAPKAAAPKAAAPKAAAPKAKPATFPLVGAPAPKKPNPASKKAEAKKAGKRIRRSVADLDRDAGRLVSAVRTAGPQGLLNEAARSQLKMEKTEWQGTLKHALDTKLVRVEGQRRSMRVFVL
jgi:hypothetical protein